MFRKEFREKILSAVKKPGGKYDSYNFEPGDFEINWNRQTEERKKDQNQLVVTPLQGPKTYTVTFNTFEIEFLPRSNFYFKARIESDKDAQFEVKCKPGDKLLVANYEVSESELASEISGWKTRIWETLTNESNQNANIWREQESVLDELDDEFDEIPDESVSEDELEELRARLDEVLEEVRSEIQEEISELKSSDGNFEERREELQEALDEIEQVVDSLKQEAQWRTKRGIAESIVQKATRWKKNNPKVSLILSNWIAPVLIAMGVAGPEISAAIQSSLQTVAGLLPEGEGGEEKDENEANEVGHESK